MKLEYSLNQLDEVAKTLLNKSKERTILFYGEMGVGKTTLIKAMLKGLGVEDKGASPTFSIINEYKLGKERVFHFDFYRIENEEEAFDLGLEEYLYSNSWCFIEWPEKVSSLLPLNCTVIEIELVENGLRKLKMR